MKDELIEHGYSKVNRIWEPILNHRIESMDECCISFGSIEDRHEIDKRNMKKFLSEFVDFYNISKQAFGNKSSAVFSLKDSYCLIIADDFSTYSYGMTRNSGFKMELFMESDNIEKSKQIKEGWYNDDIFDSVGSGLLSVFDYSWHKMWKVLNEYLFLQYIGSSEAKSIMHYYRCSY